MAKKHDLNRQMPSENPEDRAGIKDEIFEMILPVLESELSTKDFLCGSTMSMADLQIYFEV